MTGKCESLWFWRARVPVACTYLGLVARKEIIIFFQLFVASLRFGVDCYRFSSVAPDVCISYFSISWYSSSRAIKNVRVLRAIFGVFDDNDTRGTWYDSFKTLVRCMAFAGAHISISYVGRAVVCFSLGRSSPFIRCRYLRPLV